MCGHDLYTKILQLLVSTGSKGMCAVWTFICGRQKMGGLWQAYTSFEEQKIQTCNFLKDNCPAWSLESGPLKECFELAKPGAWQWSACAWSLAKQRKLAPPSTNIHHPQPRFLSNAPKQVVSFLTTTVHFEYGFHKFIYITYLNLSLSFVDFFCDWVTTHVRLDGLVVTTVAGRITETTIKLLKVVGKTTEIRSSQMFADVALLFLTVFFFHVFFSVCFCFNSLLYFLPTIWLSVASG